MPDASSPTGADLPADVGDALTEAMKAGRAGALKDSDANDIAADDVGQSAAAEGVNPPKAPSGE